jgi:hypothetical protein
MAAALIALLAWGLPKAKPGEHLTFDDEHYAPDRIASLGMNTTTREEYEPRWVEERPPYSEEEVEVLDGLAFVIDSGGSPWHRTYELLVREEATIRANLFYFPGWEAFLDGRAHESGPEPGDGRIIVRLPVGRHRLDLALRDTPARLAGKITSAMALALLGAVWLRGRRGSTGGG